MIKMLSAMLAAGALLPTIAAAEGGEVRISADLVFDGGSDAASLRADEFLDVLGRLDGQAIWLDLSLLNTRNGDETGNYYTLRAMGPVQEGDHTMSTEDGSITCGTSGEIGLLDNLAHGYEIGFSHPQHFHASVKIVVGARDLYPFHSVTCGIEGYTDRDETPLHLRGHFVVAVADIATSVSYYLFPLNPRGERVATRAKRRVRCPQSTGHPENTPRTERLGMIPSSWQVWE